MFCVLYYSLKLPSFVTTILKVHISINFYPTVLLLLEMMTAPDNHAEYDPAFPEPHANNLALVTHHGDERTALTQSIYGHGSSKNICLLVAHFESCNTEEFIKAGIELEKDPILLLLKNLPTFTPNFPIVFVQTVTAGHGFVPFSFSNSSSHTSNHLTLPLTSWEKLWTLIHADPFWKLFFKSFLSQAKSAQRGPKKLSLSNGITMVEGNLTTRTKICVDKLSNDLAIFLHLEFTHLTGETKLFLTYEHQSKTDWLELPSNIGSQTQLFSASKMMTLFFANPDDAGLTRDQLTSSLPSVTSPLHSPSILDQQTPHYQPDHSVVEKSVVDQSVADSSIVDTSVLDDPGVDQSVADQSVVEHPAIVDPVSAPTPEMLNLISMISSAPPPPPPLVSPILSLPPPSVPTTPSTPPTTPPTPPRPVTNSGKNMSNYDRGELLDGIDFDEDENFDEIDLVEEEDDLENNQSLVVLAKDGGAGAVAVSAAGAGTNPLLGDIVRQLDIDSQTSPVNPTTVSFTTNSPISIVVSHTASPEKRKNPHIPLPQRFSHHPTPPPPSRRSPAPPPPSVFKRPQNNFMQPLKARHYSNYNVFPNTPKTPTAHVSPSRGGVSHVPGAKRPASVERGASEGAASKKNKLSRNLKFD